MPKCFYLYWKFINRHVKEALILKGETFLYNMFSKGKFELKVAQVFNKRSLFLFFQVKCGGNLTYFSTATNSQRTWSSVLQTKHYNRHNLLYNFRRSRLFKVIWQHFRIVTNPYYAYLSETSDHRNLLKHLVRPTEAQLYLHI